MDLDIFQELTGTTVPDSLRAKVAANIERCRAKLETKLGYALDPDKVQTNLYTETGKLPGDGFFAWSFDLDFVTLDPPDPVVGAYRIFDFNQLDHSLLIDPFSAIHSVKLVRGSVTIWTMDVDDFTTRADGRGLRRYIELIWPIWRGRPLWNNVYGLDPHVQLAVDADWLWPQNSEGAQDIPSDLLYVWAEMVEYWANSKRLVKSETVGSHSYSKDITAPEDSPEAMAAIAAYAGGNGTAGKLPV